MGRSGALFMLPASASKKTLFATEQDRPDVARRRARWKKYQNRLDPARLVFIDETWAKTNMTRLCGWAPRGRKLLAKAPQGRWRTLTFLAALRHDRIDAPCVIDGPINGESFLSYVEQILVKVLKPGDVVIIDNLGSHKGNAVRRAIRAAGAKLLFLPPYSPDLNPIEQPSKPPGNGLAPSPVSLRPTGMRQLLQKRQIRVNLNGSDSSPLASRLLWAATAPRDA